MGGYLLLGAFLGCGVVFSEALLRSRCGLIRLWFGLVIGLIMMMWSPIPFAFAMRFTRAAQLCGLALSAAIAAGSALIMRGKARYRGVFQGDMPVWMLLCLLIPLAILSGYLQYTHTLREIDGALHVGQSTYGDINMHTGIATHLRNAAFPPDYPILKGARLGYPFLGDSMITSMLLFGADMAVSFRITGTLMMVLVGFGFVAFAWEMTKKPLAVVVAFLLLFVNGGLGFIYTMDGESFREIFTGFYKTPTNMPEYNLRWVNVICDMFIPQRTFLTGWTVLLPAVYLLLLAVREKKRRLFISLGLWAGLMPMIHTHSFLGLGLVSAGVMLQALIGSSDRRKTLINFLLYGGVAVLMAIPQLLIWTVPQTVEGSTMLLRFNWVNNNGDGTLIDNYFWFWIKNVGPVYLLLIPAALCQKRRSPARGFMLGALLLYVVAECVVFQKNIYDNNKLFYVAFMVCLPAVGALLADAIDAIGRIRSLGAKAACAAVMGVFCAICLLSGSLSIGREIASDYVLFSESEAAAGQFIDTETAEDAVFLTGEQHNCVPSALAGRDLVCGSPTFLYYHGLNYAVQHADRRAMLENPAENAVLFEKYGVDYAYISNYERGKYAVGEAWFAEHGTLVFESGSVRIYALS